MTRINISIKKRGPDMMERNRRLAVSVLTQHYMLYDCIETRAKHRVLDFFNLRKSVHKMRKMVGNLMF
jgi:hypothetical protein